MVHLGSRQRRHRLGLRANAARVSRLHYRLLPRARVGELLGPGLFGMVGAAVGSMVVSLCGLINAAEPSSVNSRGSSPMPSVAVSLRIPLSMTSAIVGVRRSVGQTTRR